MLLDALGGYLDYLRVERGLAKSTLESYQRDILHFCRWLGEHGKEHAAEIGEATASEYLAAHAELSAPTLSRRLSSLSGFFKFLQIEERVDSNPFRWTSPPRTRRPLPRTLEASEVMRLLAGLGGSSEARRDLALFSLLFSSGLRVSEVCGLSAANLDRSRGVVRVVGKGGKERAVPVAAFCLDAISAYLAESPERQVAKTLFADRGGRPLSRQAVWRLLKNHAKRVGLSSSIYPHKLRHTFATELLRGGADVRSLQVLLGHASISTSQIYTQVGNPDISRSHRAFHPRGG